MENLSSKDLRQGNLLDYYGQYVIVLEIKRNENIECGYFNDSIGFERKLTENHSPKPVELTEELLLKCGASKKWLVEWHGNGFDYQPENSKTIQQDYVLGNIIVRYETSVFNNESTTELLIGIIGDWYEKISFDNLLLCELRGLHHFQNIVKDLTQTELQITL